MKYLRNPVDHKVVVATPLMAKKLFRYGWEYVTKRDWVEYQRAQVQAAMVKNMPSVRTFLGRVQ